MLYVNLSQHKWMQVNVPVLAGYERLSGKFPVKCAKGL